MAWRQDVALGLVFAALGLFVAFQALQYRGATGVYPLALSLAIAALGAGIALRAAVRGSDANRPIVVDRRHLAVALVGGALYLLLVPRVGFYTASALLVAAMPVAFGFRRPVYLAAVTAVFIALVWAVFSLVLEKPLPRELLARLGG